MRRLKYIIVFIIALVAILALAGGIMTSGVKPLVAEVDRQHPALEAHRMAGNPIIHTDMDSMLIQESLDFGYQNINGPSLIRVPEWLPDPMGQYYLYFAHHKGKYIRLAYADSLSGPWQLHDQPILPLAQSGMQVQPGVATTVGQLFEMNAITESMALLEVSKAYQEAIKERKAANEVGAQATDPHVASPEVIIDATHKTIRLYYHGVVEGSLQKSKVALSKDGLYFEPTSEIIALPYLRIFEHREQYYGIAMPGMLYRSEDGISDFEVRKRWLFSTDTRHCGILQQGDLLYVFYSRVGDAPERLYYSTMDISAPDWDDWIPSPPIELMRPQESWEGVDLPMRPSRRGESSIAVNELRDPDVFVDSDGRIFLLYTGQGEQNIGIAELTIKHP